MSDPRHTPTDAVALLGAIFILALVTAWFLFGAPA